MSAQSDKPAPANRPLSELAESLVRYSEDLQALNKKYAAPFSTQRDNRLREFWLQQQMDLAGINFEALSTGGKVDYALMAEQLRYELQRQNDEREKDRRAIRLVPSVDQLVNLLEQHQTQYDLDGKPVAQCFTKVTESLSNLNDGIQQLRDQPIASTDAQTRFDALRAAKKIDELRRQLAAMNKFYDGYDPEYSWWVRRPFAALDKSLADHANMLRKDVLGVASNDKDTIVGQPIGQSALQNELRHELIRYTPQQLVRIAQQQFQWCDREMDLAAKEMGFDDWRDAQEKVKNAHVQPGDQPDLIRTLANEAADFLEQRDLLTIPRLAREGWRMQMMSPEAQRVNPYFLGGESIIVSFPTDTMTHAEKLMSMRGNNEHFARATVHHELIPGHHLQQFMTRRYRPDREIFWTPFWMEGWALYWEMRLWDLGFARSPEDRIGMLFWRKHRCARIIFSLNYQLGEWTPQQCIDFLVQRVGHERKNATAEVRRSVMGGYSPLYQAAYMLGGLQIRSMHEDLVRNGKMSERTFHDTILQEGTMPITALRSILYDDPPTKNGFKRWDFQGDPSSRLQSDQDNPR
ncbi:MAG: DUF885 family protein [Planctomycetota bacterium]